MKNLDLAGAKLEVVTTSTGMALSGFVRVTAGCLRVAQHAPRKRYLSREGAPLGQCGRASLLVNLAGDEMALLIEMVVDLGVN